MKSTTIRITLLLAGAFALISANQARAELVSWDVDPSQSFMRLNIPDQTLSLDGTSATVRVRAANSATWSDTTGKRAFLDGFLSTDYNDGNSIAFNGGANALVALNSGNFRPNPADFNPANVNADNPDGQYSGSATAPAAFAGKIRGSVSILTLDLAYIAFRNVMLDIASGAIPLTGGGTAFAGGTNNFGIASAVLDVDGLDAAIVGQVVPDILNSPLTNLAGTNTLGGTIADLGGLARRLTVQINVPIAIDVDGTIINATATGQIVAFTTLVPEPSSVVLAGFAAFGLCWAGRRRMRRA